MDECLCGYEGFYQEVVDHIAWERKNGSGIHRLVDDRKYAVVSRNLLTGFISISRGYDTADEAREHRDLLLSQKSGKQPVFNAVCVKV